MLIPRSLKVVYTSDRYGDTFQVDREIKVKKRWEGERGEGNHNLKKQ